MGLMNDRYTGLIVWGKKVSGAFLDKVIKICDDILIDANWLMSCMAFESAETFSPKIKNKYSGATGLIQFMGPTAAALGTTINELAKMTAVKQLDYVHKYFLPYKRRLHSLEDTYMAILFPAGIGKRTDYPLFLRDDPRYPERYLQNKGLDKNNDGIITKAEAAIMIWDKFQRGLMPGNVKITREYFEKANEAAGKIQKAVT